VQVDAAAREPRQVPVHLLVRGEQDAARDPAGRVEVEGAGLARVGREGRQRQHAVEADHVVEQELDQIIGEQWVGHGTPRGGSARDPGETRAYGLTV
jgi:hypothetical protein